MAPKTTPPDELKSREILDKNIYAVGKTPPENLEWVKVEAGDSLEKIAHDYAWQLNDLLFYNWKTSDKEPEVVNWYLQKIGCSHTDDKGNYIFKGDENPGMILVPKVKLRTFSLTETSAARDGKVVVDSRLQVAVMEVLPDASYIEVSGKWLYVFSASGLDFGYVEDEKEKDGWERAYFNHGIFHLDNNKQPDKLEYEIYITPEKPLSSAQKDELLGADYAENSKFKYGSNWYFLSDRKFLDKVKSDSRHIREETTDNYIHRKFKTVQIELMPDGNLKRFYFLLSPVKLGPKAITYAMEHPNGLTPLLKRNTNDKPNRISGDPAFDGDSAFWKTGPNPFDISHNPISLFVIDPYDWANTIANKIIPGAVKDYDAWLKKDQDSAIKDLEQTTDFKTLTHLFVAQTLKSVYDSHPKSNEIDKVLKDPEKWKNELETWEKRLNDVSASKLRNIHITTIQLIHWLSGDAHKIIETAILQDIDTDSPIDGIDVGIGLTHWGINFEALIATQPGIVFLRDVCTKNGIVAYDKCLKYTMDVVDALSPDVSVATVIGWRLANLDLLLMDALADIVTLKPPTFAPNATLQEKKEKIGKSREEEIKKLDYLIKLLNDNEVFPGELKRVVPLTKLKGSPWNWDRDTAAITALLDVGDKFKEVLFPTKKYEIKLKELVKSNVPDKLSLINENQGKYDRNFKNGGRLTWSLKWLSFGFAYINGIRLFKKIIDGGDYQWTDIASATSSLIASSYDLMVGIANYNKLEGWGLQKFFPELEELAEKGAGTFGASAGARIFARANAAAMIVSGVVTVITMEQSASKAHARGDYSAAVFYQIGAVGGVAIAGGGTALAYSLLVLGGEATISVAFAPVGLILITAGGLVALIGGWIGSGLESDDYTVFARKCFLGKEGAMNPRFEDDPPDWSFAPKEGEWTIKQQKQALITLLCRFTLKTDATQNPSASTMELKQGVFRGSVLYDIVPGMILPGTTFEIGLHLKDRTVVNHSATVLLNQPEKNGFMPTSLVKYKENALFDVKKTTGSSYFNGKRISKIVLVAEDVHFVKEDKRDDEHDGSVESWTELLTVVTMRYPGSKDIIQADKGVMMFQFSKGNESNAYQWKESADTVSAKLVNK